jgi:hypothetical protein
MISAGLEACEKAAGRTAAGKIDCPRVAKQNHQQIQLYAGRDCSELDRL